MADHDDQVDAMTQLLDYLEKCDDIDFSRDKCHAIGPDRCAGNSQYQPMGQLWSTRSESARTDGGGPIADANAPFPQVRAWVVR